LVHQELIVSREKDELGGELHRKTAPNEEFTVKGKTDKPDAKRGPFAYGRTFVNRPWKRRL